VPDLRAGACVLVVSHGNTLRALVNHLDATGDEEIMTLNIPNGTPLLYRLDPDMAAADPRRVLPLRGRRRARVMNRRLMHATAEALSAVPLFVTTPLYRHWHRRWGATDEEVHAAMPGDDLVPNPSFNATRAITIQAPPEQVWPWIVQMGYRRGGFYTYALLDNAGYDSADQIIAEYQQPRVGDWMPMVKHPTEATAFRVQALVTNSWLVWEKPDSTWVWKLTPGEGGATRLCTRLRLRYPWETPASAITTLILLEFGDFAMMRRVLLGIKARAERMQLTAERTPKEAAMPVTATRAPARPRGRRLYRRLAEDDEVLALPAAPPPEEPVSEAKLAGLPDPARRYLRFAGAVGRPADWSFQLHSRGRFRLRGGWPWMPCEAWQYNSRLEVARVFHMRIDVAGLLPMLGRDSYLSGRGQMLGRLLGLVTVANGSGPEYDASELVTFLNDAVIFAPSMLLRLPVSWSAAGDRSFDITLADSGHRVTARVFLDERDAVRDFSTGDRYADTPGGLVQARWSTPVRGWREMHGRRLPSSGSAIWHLPDGPLTYAELTFGPGDISYNAAPAALRPGRARSSGGPARSRPRPRERARALRSQATALRNWGATQQEQEMTFPGDELIPEPADVITRGVTVRAPAEQVWRWLVQIGQDRGGLYSYDWLDNMLGLRINSAREIREEWQHLTPGDEVRLVPRGWLGMKHGLALPVTRVDPGRAIVLREQPPAHPWNAVWSFHLLPIDTRQCRLLSRSRAARQRGPARVASAAMDPVTLTMTRKMLLGIKERAERHGTILGRPA
jgi:hypothetical protein